MWFIKTFWADLCYFMQISRAWMGHFRLLQMSFYSWIPVRVSQIQQKSIQKSSSWFHWYVPNLGKNSLKLKKFWHWPDSSTKNTAYTNMGYQISFLNRSCLQQIQTNVSVILHLGEVCCIYNGQKPFWDWPNKSVGIQNWCMHHTLVWYSRNPWPLLIYFVKKNCIFRNPNAHPRKGKTS